MGTMRLLCISLAFLLGTCSAGHVGKEFVTTFMQNYRTSYGTPKLELVINSYEASTSVTVTMNGNNFKKVLLLGKDEMASVVAPSSSEIGGSARSYKTVIVTSNKGISVSSFNIKYRTVDASVIYPVSSLGKEYYIFTPPTGPWSVSKEFAITNTDQPNTVSVYLSNTAQFQGRIYWPRSTIKLSLKPYESAQFQSLRDLTGSRVVASQRLAVMSGHACSMRNYKCNHVYEQLPPVDSWGTSFLVAPTSVQTKFDQVYVLASQPTELRVNSDAKVMNLQAGKTAMYKVSLNQPIAITASKGVLVLFYSPGDARRRGIRYDPFLMTVIPNNQFASSYTVRGISNFENYISIVAKSSDKGQLRLDSHELPAGATWRTIGESGYSWVDFTVGKGQEKHVVDGTSGEKFAVYKYGIAGMNAYGCQGSAGGTSEPVGLCNTVKCRSKEQCVVVDGNAVCQPVSRAVCWAWGDPHYHTFDGVNFDFQGTCTYTIAKSCGADSSLPSFNIDAKNDNRGNTRVAYVMLVNIEVYDYKVTVFKHEYSQVRINGVRSNLPLTLHEGKVKLYQSGAYVIIETDFQLKVTYDWNHHLVVTVSSSYFGNVCGLCGNYNGDARDDFRSPQGTAVSNALDFGKSWKVSDGDIFCWDNCNGVCPTCDAESRKRYESPSSCGLIGKADGPFRECRAKIDPKPYLDSCVYDVCLSKGLQTLLCQAMKAYAEVCQREDVKIYDWRTPSKCPLPCPENSHYEACGSACPATCTDPSATATCQQACVESCVCNKGLVLSAGKCVSAQSCGCTYQGRYYKAGETFWGDEKCQSLCRCEPLSKNVQCTPQGCKQKEQCKVVKGVRGCHPVGYGTCSAAGDPHYHTFDRLKYDFQGTCVYKFSSLCAKDTELVPFDVQVQNEHRGNKVVSFTRLVWIVVYGQTIVITRDYIGKVLVNGVLVNLPYSLEDSKISIYKSGRGATLEADFGMRVTYDWRSRITVTLPSTYASAVCGLCGDFDGNSKNDLKTKNGEVVSSPAKFGESWQVDTTPGCTNECKGKCPECDIVAKRRYETPEFCGRILDRKGPFRDCLERVSPDDYFDDCVYDSCLYKGHQTVLCQAVASYSAACQDAGAPVYQWRSKRFCPMVCPENSHYEVCASGCPVSCGTLSEPAGCTASCAEGCQCDDGFVLSGDQCVPLAHCGCLYQGAYYKSGQVFYPSGKCSERCTCEDGGAVSCQKVKCGKYEECKVVNGEQGCHAVGVGTCTAAGDPHYLSFDGRAFDFQGTCTYTLAQVCEKEDRLPKFTVNVENESYGNGKVAVTRLVEVEAHGYKLILEQKVHSKVKLNGVLNNLPLTLDNGKIRAYQHGNKAVIETDFGLVVSYDLTYYVVVTVPGNYREKMCGLCGNFNSKKQDEFKLRDGTVTRDVTEFGKSWRVFFQGAKCNAGCGNQCPVCEPKKLAVFKKGNYCGFLNSASSPLAACHTVVNPKQFYLDCLYDTCQSNGDNRVLCDSIQAYVEACQAQKVNLKAWRSESFCPMKCPANSHYEVCADTCATTCAGITDQSKCPDTCSEGCQCDDGYFVDGDQCVPIENCGCFENGHYYQLDDVVIQKDCKERCMCSAVGLVCEEISCTTDEKCGIKNGVMGCYNKDPCKAAKCRVKETCKVENGDARCVPQYTGKCWAWGDPHYHTFDNLNFNFQGTCTYIVAETCGSDRTLMPFKIEAKNDIRGNSAVSYVKLVHVHVYGYKISIHKSEIGQVRVNDVRTSLPVTLVDGKLRLYQSGMFAVLQTDFGLKVSYEWRWYLIIEVPSSYFGNLCGLCGNFNGQNNDEKLSPNGTSVSSVVEWAGSWKVNDRDPFCWDYCHGYCPTCADDKRLLYESEKYCGLLKSVFKLCHDKVDHRPFFDSCVYDVCLNQGRKSMLCQALAAYATECQKEGVTVKQWRQEASCPYECPENSHYEACGRACEPTCQDPDAVTHCSLPCVESCQCDAGHVLVEGKCVPSAACGCTHQGLYYKPNERFWADDKCHVECFCDPALKMVVCEEKQCKSNELCATVDGVRGCIPASYSTCSASGDPHYITFDGTRYNFMGTCVYKLSVLCSKDADLTHYEVLVQNNHRGSKAVSYTKVVTVKVYQTTIVLSVAEPQRILVNGLLSALPYYFDTDRISIYRSGWTAVVQTDFGLKVTFDWQSHVTVTLPSTYSGAVCGLCGNYDGSTNNDLLLPSGKVTVGADSFGNSWKVADAPGCVSGCGQACPECGKSDAAKYSEDRFCGMIHSKLGPFRDCFKAVDPSRFFQDCLYDLCHYRGLGKALCDALSLYTAACQEAGAKVYQWRSHNFCPADCPKNAHYELCGSGCPATCYSLTAPDGCQTPCKESCQCDDGFILSGDQCLPLSECGCVYNGGYRKKGEVFYPSGLCEERCTCLGDGEVQCVASTCGEGEVCKVANGVQGCHPASYGKCVASGDPHYISFDGRRFDFQGTCTYILSKVVTPGGSLVDFNVSVENVKWGNGKVAVTRLVVVDVYGHRFTLEQGVKWKVQVDGELFNLPFQLRCERVKVTQEGNKIVLWTEFGLQVMYDTVYYVAVVVPSTYKGKLGGLCGNYNDEKTDDFTLPGGKTTTDVTEFGSNWKVFVKGAQCNDGCGNECPRCDAAKKSLFSKEKACGLIKAAKGPFATCAKVVSPDQFFDNCLYDLCEANGQPEVLCDSLQAYTIACQAAGVQIQSWRNKDFCPLSCPANSHYELCADTCEDTCAEIITPGDCDDTCSEGCQCDAGYVFSGNECVPLETCGCVYQGRYFKANEIIFTQGCMEKCTCFPTGAVLCEKVGCSANEVCQLRNGVRGCYITEGVCSVKEGQQFATFDGTAGQIQAPGTYELVSVCDESSAVWFRALVEFRTGCEHEKLGGAAVYMYFEGAFIAVTEEKSIWVNGRQLKQDQLPFKATSKVSIRIDLGAVIVEHTAKLQVSFRGFGDLTVTVAGTFSNQLCGACGNFDGSTNGELRMPNGKVTTDIQQFFRAWLAKEFSSCLI
ncbi:IgGFc-binding protein-like [Heterodontus francisci]|uniref:IgGFc-binding protein-like n=1 Tax=Heterodontus francisci TaxID=7792 RepID=UPI00355C4099